MKVNSSPANNILNNNSLMRYNEVPAKAENKSPSKTNYAAIALASVAATAVGVATLALSKGKINNVKLLSAAPSQALIPDAVYDAAGKLIAKLH